MTSTTDILIIGGGAIGGALAWSLARRGAEVTVVAAQVGQGASEAAAGVLSSEWNLHESPALASLAEASLALWPEWVAELEDRTGVGLNFRRDGLLNTWVDPEAPHLPPELATAPVPIGKGELLSAAEVRHLEPLLTGPIAGGVLSRDDAQVDNPRLAPTLLRAASDLGARILTNSTVVALLGARGVCNGVRTACGRELAAGSVVLAAGAWSGPLAESAGIRLPVEPWRGQMLAFDTPRRPFRHIVFCGELVLIARPHGPLLVGTTLEKAGFENRVTLAGLHHILSRAERIAPGLGDLPLARTWSGLRPGTPDGLPYLGPVPGWEGLYAACGHGRKGIILAPITGELLARLILDRDCDPMLTAFLPSRVVR